jgi:hypothetical protein
VLETFENVRKFTKTGVKIAKNSSQTLEGMLKSVCNVGKFLGPGSSPGSPHLRHASTSLRG